MNRRIARFPHISPLSVMLIPPLWLFEPICHSLDALVAVAILILATNALTNGSVYKPPCQFLIAHAPYAVGVAYHFRGVRQMVCAAVPCGFCIILCLKSTSVIAIPSNMRPHDWHSRDQFCFCFGLCNLGYPSGKVDFSPAKRTG